jgi:hypothetical protein
MNLNEFWLSVTLFTSKDVSTTRSSSPPNKAPVYVNTTAHRIYAPSVAFAYSGSAPRFATPTRGELIRLNSKSSQPLLNGTVPPLAVE